MALYFSAPFYILFHHLHINVFILSQNNATRLLILDSNSGYFKY
ncbi:hypothetical protein T05_10254 [Trichinella murrelli]|uniref:Uncharacterized protein n=1 Tax=Trichinella murrelli TaxID=144512 RepID=A0A0V0SRD3_9BILA|nr:hypothetical protein T05_10254 [Trichinella murrelli]